MIKQTWVVNEEEKKRILSLHENATKRQYLMKEQETETPSLIQNNMPKNIRFGFPLKKFNKPGTQECMTNDKGEVFMILNDYSYKLPTIQEINLPKFWITDDGFLEGTDEWSWINEFNEIILRPNPQGDRNIYIPSYDKSTFQLHFLFYDLIDISKREAKKLKEAEDFLQVNDNKYVYYNGNFKVVGGDDLPLMQSIPLSGSTTPTKPEEKPKVETIKLDISEPFVFDSVELTAQAKPIFEKFINDVIENYKGVSADTQVITSSSVDGDPSQKLKSGITRSQYDMDLSQRRAQAIADILNSRVGIPSLRFIPIGIGQTTQYGPGWTQENPTTPDQTAPNRRLIINLPPLKKEIPK